jgi:hypothetical protein
MTDRLSRIEREGCRQLSSTGHDTSAPVYFPSRCGPGGKGSLT